MANPEADGRRRRVEEGAQLGRRRALELPSRRPEARAHAAGRRQVREPEALWVGEQVQAVPHVVHGLSSAPSARCTVWECTMREALVSASQSPNGLDQSIEALMPAVRICSLFAASCRSTCNRQ